MMTYQPALNKWAECCLQGLFLDPLAVGTIDVLQRIKEYALVHLLFPTKPILHHINIMMTIILQLLLL